MTGDLARIAAQFGVPFDVVRETWSERAAIREYDGGASRERT